MASEDNTDVREAPPSQGVTVATHRFQDAPLYGRTPLQAGLLYGGAASTVLGPGIGALVGLGAGIITKLERDNVIDHRARQVNDVVSETQGLQSQAQDMLATSDPDSAQAKFIQEQMRLANEGMTRFVNEADPQGRVQMQNANINLAGVLSAQMEQARNSAMAQETAKRSLITSQAELYRNQFQTNQDNFRDINTQADKILSLTAEKGFDPTKPINVGLITSMLSRGVDVYNSNPNDYATAITQGVSGLDKLGGKAGGVIAAGASVVTGLVNYYKGKDIAPTTQDYIRLAMNMKDYAAKDAGAKSDQINQQSAFMDQQARKWGVFDEHTDLQGYVTGGVNKLPITKAPEQPPAPTAAQLLPSTSQTPTDQPRTAPTAARVNSQMTGRGMAAWAQNQGTQSTAAPGASDIALGLSQARPTN
jgi:hypothetical protein